MLLSNFKVKVLRNLDCQQNQIQLVRILYIFLYIFILYIFNCVDYSRISNLVRAIKGKFVVPPQVLCYYNPTLPDLPNLWGLNYYVIRQPNDLFSCKALLIITFFVDDQYTCRIRLFLSMFTTYFCCRLAFK